MSAQNEIGNDIQSSPNNQPIIENQSTKITEGVEKKNKKSKIISAITKGISAILVSIEWVYGIAYSNVPEYSKEYVTYEIYLKYRRQYFERYFSGDIKAAGFMIFWLLIANVVTILLIGRIVNTLNNNASSTKLSPTIKNWLVNNAKIFKKVLSTIFVVVEWFLFIRIIEIPVSITIWIILANIVTVLLVVLTIGSLNKDTLRKWFRFGKKDASQL